ncbi:uncharacterized protein [Apostichopus japonicus]|uniref:uncharacterized protein isoform X1 n=1 Tax=Stichopus japonicus TaxID=307972 RepID=UPI003AB461CA
MIITKMIAVFVVLVVFTAVNSLPAWPVITHLNREQDYEQSPNKENKPCDIQISGPWSDVMNFTASPNPPRFDSLLKLDLDLYIKEDLLSVTYKANVSIDGKGFQTFEKPFCGFQTRSDFCPAEKGARSHYELAIYVGFIVQYSFSCVAQFLNQDDEMLFTIITKNCTIN